jgi:ArsR family transcriptional regulator, arsenate/arsenite/antimonite-responsive transcriptional repressor
MIQQNKTALLLKAMGHPARVAIIEYLLTVESCVCGDIVNELPLAQPTISQHLKELKSVGIIKGSVEGTSVCYCLNSDVLNELEKYFNVLNKKIGNKGECC